LVGRNYGHSSVFNFRSHARQTRNKASWVAPSRSGREERRFSERLTGDA
jgi:hypothetical protein